jgi:hypothetical protein
MFERYGNMEMKIFKNEIEKSAKTSRKRCGR